MGHLIEFFATIAFTFGAGGVLIFLFTAGKPETFKVYEGLMTAIFQISQLLLIAAIAVKYLFM